MLAQKRCIPCEGGVEPLSMADVQKLLKEVSGWTTNGKRITKSYSFKNFAKALAFANKIGAIAEEENHHPSLLVEWGRVNVELSTHSIGGLSKNDFILAGKIDAQDMN